TLVELHTGMPARIGEPVEHLAHGYSKDLSSPIYATAIGLLKYTIDNLPDKVYVEYDNDEMVQPEMPVRNAVDTQKRSNDDDFEEEEVVEAGERSSAESKFLGFMKKIGVYAKDFFEPTPDHEL
ncbi:MAG TPA: hypothetical protein PLV12_14635, partial [Saprospiraceae bacterium]|nr:hypothetical protein [Saprospiraceae bacterium]